MSFKIFNTAIAIILASTSQTIQASDFNSYYVGLKYGSPNISTNIEIDGFKSNAAIGEDLKADGDNAYGVVFGYNITRNISLEFNYTKVNADSTVGYYLRPAEGVFSGLGEQLYEFHILGDEIDFKNYALSAAYRTNGNLYLIIKGGYLYRETDISRFESTINTFFYKPSDYGSNFIFGLGGGINFGNIQTELQFSHLSDDIDIVELGINYTF